MKNLLKREEIACSLKSEEQQLLYGEKQVFASGQKQAILEK
jgi:hypothetical protein